MALLTDRDTAASNYGTCYERQHMRCADVYTTLLSLCSTRSGVGHCLAFALIHRKVDGGKKKAPASPAWSMTDVFLV